MKKSQNQLILDLLIDEGEVTQVIASNYGIRRLASRIDELKNHEGLEIRTEILRDAAGVKFARYYLDYATRVREAYRRTSGMGWRAVA